VGTLIVEYWIEMSTARQNSGRAAPSGMNGSPLQIAVALIDGLVALDHPDLIGQRIHEIP
jgi:hypothetical protein